MLTLVLLGLLLALLQSFIPAGFKVTANEPKIIAGPQDHLHWTPQGDRSQRALRNLHETLPIFLTLGVLAVALHIGSGLAIWGAVVYLVARVLYVPLFVFGVSNLRSLAYIVGLAGLALMAIPVVGSIGAP